MITGKTVREFLNYDPLTGIFTWQKPSGRASVGMIAGRLDSGGYRQIMLIRLMHTNPEGH